MSRLLPTGSTKPPRVPVVGALLFHIEKPPMLLDELDSGLSNSSFSFSSGQPSIGAPLIFIIPCISVNGKFIGKKRGSVYFFIL